MSQATKAGRSFDRLLERAIRVEYPAAATFMPEAAREVFPGCWKNLPKLSDPQASAWCGGK